MGTDASRNWPLYNEFPVEVQKLILSYEENSVAGKPGFYSIRNPVQQTSLVCTPEEVMDGYQYGDGQCSFLHTYNSNSKVSPANHDALLQETNRDETPVPSWVTHPDAVPRERGPGWEQIQDSDAAIWILYYHQGRGFAYAPPSGGNTELMTVDELLLLTESEIDFSGNPVRLPRDPASSTTVMIRNLSNLPGGLAIAEMGYPIQAYSSSGLVFEGGRYLLGEAGQEEWHTPRELVGWTGQFLYDEEHLARKDWLMEHYNYDPFFDRNEILYERLEHRYRQDVISNLFIQAVYRGASSNWLDFHAALSEFETYDLAFMARDPSAIWGDIAPKYLELDDILITTDNVLQPRVSPLAEDLTEAGYSFPYSIHSGIDIFATNYALDTKITDSAQSNLDQLAGFLGSVVVDQYRAESRDWQPDSIDQHMMLRRLENLIKQMDSLDSIYGYSLDPVIEGFRAFLNTAQEAYNGRLEKYDAAYEYEIQRNFNQRFALPGEVELGIILAGMGIGGLQSLAARYGIGTVAKILGGAAATTEFAETALDVRDIVQSEHPLSIAPAILLGAGANRLLSALPDNYSYRVSSPRRHRLTQALASRRLAHLRDILSHDLGPIDLAYHMSANNIIRKSGNLIYLPEWGTTRWADLGTEIQPTGEQIIRPNGRRDFDLYEANVALAYEYSNPEITLRRSRGAGDLVDQHNTVYDVMATPYNANPGIDRMSSEEVINEMEIFSSRALRRHLNRDKSGDVLLIDVTGLTPSQVSDVRMRVYAQWKPEDLTHVRRIEFISYD